MPNLFSKDEDLLKSAPIVGYEILKLVDESDNTKISIFDIARRLKSKYKGNARVLYYGMLFLYSIDVIDFDAPYVLAKNATHTSTLQ